MQHTSIISIIDDDEAVRTAAHSFVTSLGYEAYAFESAEQFLQSPRLTDTACLISDVQMPAMSGVQLQQLLKAQGRDIPIIFMTAFFSEEMKAKALRCGAVCFLDKPFNGRALIDCIGKALGELGDGHAGG